jgi:Flp pilus assembly protein protease CpaA
LHEHNPRLHPPCAPATSPTLTNDRGRLSNCTEVGVPVLTVSVQAIALRHSRACLFAAVVALVGLCALGPAVPVAVVAVISVWAAAVDRRTLRIPNAFVLSCWSTVAVASLALSLVDGKAPSQLVPAVALGTLLAGGPMLFVVWLARPAAVGGGDWKLLVGQGAALGLVAPLAAGLILLVAAPLVIVQRSVGRRSTAVALGPGLAVGFVAAASAAFLYPQVLGGPP